jgi:hypothetical protein
MAIEDIPYGLVTQGITERHQGTGNAIIAPGAILLSQTHHQGFQLRMHSGTSRRFPLLRAVKLLRHELAVPSEDRLRGDDCGDLRQGFLPQLLPKLGQSLPLAIAQLHATCDLLAQNPVFCHQVFVA